MSKLLAATVIVSFALAPLTAAACGDSMADSSADKVGLQAPPAATKAPLTVAKATAPKAQKPSAKEAKVQDPAVKVASTR